jgi:hypothetical protein
MIRFVYRIAAPAAVAAVSVALFGGVAQAGDPQDQDGAAGEPGNATATCRYEPPMQDGWIRCTATPGEPGAGGAAVEY